MIEFLEALLMWVIVFVPSAGATSLLSKNNPKSAGFAMEISTLLVSFAILFLMGGPGKFGFVWNVSYVLPALSVGFVFSLLLNAVLRRISPEGGNTEPEFLPEGAKRIFLLIFLAPFSEETLCRGLAEGYLLSYGYFWSAIIFSAMLFALPYWRAFEGNVADRASVVAGAFALGTLAGYFFALGGIVPAFILHSSANLAGLTALHLRETPRYK